MRRMLLISLAAVMALVPGGTIVFTAFFPRSGRIMPIGFWPVWLLLSLGATFYAPVVVDRLTPPDASSYQCAAYARSGIALGLINIAWSVVEILWVR